MTYGNIYVACVAMGAKDEHTLKAFLEAEAYDGPALIIAYSHCIAHGINMTTGLQNQKAAVNSGQWLLYRYNPERAATRRKSAATGFRRAADQARRISRDGEPVQDAREESSGGCEGFARPGAGGSEPALEVVSTSGRARSEAGQRTASETKNPSTVES